MEYILFVTGAILSVTGAITLYIYMLTMSNRITLTLNAILVLIVISSYEDQN